ncbi:MAG TPA: protease pro-enzyme activation domain-containing protein [Acidimicrobiales bacterium]|nr:protease pro-enzyme activation domain-containing protein [Acidimicrobiales bacterium]
MRSIKRWRFVAASGAGLLAAGLLAIPSYASGSAGSTGPMVRTHNFLPGLSLAKGLGNAPKSQVLTVGVALSHPDVAAEEATYKAIYDPSSPEYHHFLTPAEYNQRFGVPASETSELQSWLRSGGLTIQTVSGSGDYVTARGTLAQIGSLMSTNFGSYQVGPYRFIANRIPPAVPASLPISTVLGLNTLQRVWTPLDIARANSSTGTAPRSATGGYLGTLNAQDLWGAYDMPSSDEGQGETAGVFGDGYFNSVITDLRLFEQRENLPAVPVQPVLTEGGTANDYPDNAESVEWMLDSQSITGVAPKLSQLDLYFAKTPLDADIAAAMADWVSDPSGPKQMNASFGECESDPLSTAVKGSPYTNLLYGVGLGNQLESMADATLREATMEGRTLFAAAGDTGGACPFVILPVIGAGNGLNPQPLPEAGYPASSAYATAVGGTVLTTTGTTAQGATNVKRASEVSWDFSGGGTSVHTPEPDYQKGVAAVKYPCLGTTDDAGNSIAPGTTCRGGPDIAAMSGQGFTDSGGGLLSSNGYEMSADALPFPEGGTSLSSPLSVGMWSRIQAAAPSAKGIGFANETIYKVAQGPSYHKDFYDITQAEHPTGNFFYQNAPGWDYVSGWGVMDVANLISDPQVDNNPAATPTHPAGQAPEVPVVSCSATMTSPVGNAYDFSTSLMWPTNTDPSLDIRTATLSSSPDGKSIIATISGPTLAPSTPPNALQGAQWLMTFTYQGQTFFVGAELSPQQQLSYVEGHVVADTFTYQTDHTETNGSFANGTMKVTVPLSDIALASAKISAPSGGKELLYPYAITLYPGFPFVNFATDTAAPDQPGQAVIVKPCSTTAAGTNPGGTGPVHVGVGVVNPFAGGGNSGNGNSAGGRVGSGSAALTAARASAQHSSASENLPFTGFNAFLMALAGLLLISTGTGVALISRQRGITLRRS